MKRELTFGLAGLLLILTIGFGYVNAKAFTAGQVVDTEESGPMLIEMPVEMFETLEVAVCDTEDLAPLTVDSDISGDILAHILRKHEVLTIANIGPPAPSGFRSTRQRHTTTPINTIQPLLTAAADSYRRPDLC